MASSKGSIAKSKHAPLHRQFHNRVHDVVVVRFQCLFEFKKGKLKSLFTFAAFALVTPACCMTSSMSLSSRPSVSTSSSFSASSASSSIFGSCSFGAACSCLNLLTASDRARERKSSVSTSPKTM
jgi:hypothetical protein